MKIRFALLSLLLLLVLAILAFSTLLFTEGGSRWLVKRLTSEPQLGISVAGIQGTLWDGLQADEIRYVSEDWLVAITEVALTTEAKDLLQPRLNISQLSAKYMRIEQLRPTRERDSKPLVFPEIPIDVLIQVLALNRLELYAFGLKEEINDIQVAGKLLGQKLSLKHIALELRQFAVDGTADISLTETLPVHATVNWRADDLNLSGSGTIGGDLNEIYIQQQVSTPDPVEIQAQITQAREDLGYEIRIRANQLRVPNSPENLRLEDLSAFLAGDKERLIINDLQAGLLGGEISGNGEVELRDSLPIRVQFLADRVELHRLAEIPNSWINFDAELTGSLLDQQTLRTNRLRGLLGDYEVAGSLVATRQQDQVRVETGKVTIGDNHANFMGLLTPKIQGEFNLEAKNLTQLLPELEGELLTQGSFAGTLSKPILTFDGRGKAVGFRNQSIESLVIDAHIDGDGEIAADLSATSINAADRPWGDAKLTIDGTLDDHRVALDLSGGEISGNLRSRGQYNEESLSESIGEASIDLGALGIWQLEKNLRAQLDLGNGHFSASAHCWQLESASACIEKMSRDAQGFEVTARVIDFPAQQFNLVTPDYMQLQGEIDADLQVSEQGNGLQGFMAIGEENLRIELTTDEEVLITNFDLAELEIRGNEEDALVNLQLVADHDSRLQAQLTIDSPFADRSPLSGSFDGKFRDLTEISALLEAASGLRKIRGELVAEGTFLGSLQQPQIRGGLNLNNGAIMVPSMGIEVSRIEVELAGDQNGQARIMGRASSGEGQIEFSGTASVAERSASFDITGDRFESLRLPDQQALSSPDIKLAYKDEAISIDGILRIPEANFLVNEVPETAVKPSPDAIDHDAPDAEQQRKILRVNGTVNVALGDAVQFDGMGLKTKLTGELELRQTRKRQLFANGVLSLLDGRFSAYGQSLSIERGRLIFSGPIDNPRVDIKTSRTVNYEGQIVKAGVILSGMADNISTRVYAEPSMSEANALSYLVIGRPIDQAGSGDSAALSNAAITMGLRKALPVIQQVGDTLGLDEVGIGGDSTNETAFLAGKQLSDDLSIRYTYGLFSRIGTFIARYSLGRGFSIEASSGEDQALELIYTVER